MSKKSGTIFKIVAVVAGIAAVGTACYIYKDKIKEFFEKIQLKQKIESAKTFISEKVMGNKEEDFFDDADFFDDETEVAIDDSTNRGYTSINLTTEDSSTPKAEDIASKEETITADEEADDASFEYEGLSDVSEDEDVLEEETALEGTV